MKKAIHIVLLFILCASLTLSSAPAAAASGSGAPKESASAQPSKEPDKNEPTYNTKYTVKKIKKPPYCISVNGNENQDFSTGPWTAGAETRINVVGQKDDDGIAGEWQFFVDFKLVFEGDATIEGVPGGMQMGLTASVNGSAKGDMIDLAEKKKQEKEDKKNDWQPVFPSEKPSDAPKPTPIHTDPNTIRNSQEAPKELYKCEFDVDLSGTIENLGPSTVYGEFGDESQWIKVDANFLENTNVNTKGKVKITVDSNNNVIVYVEADGKSYGPYAGVFTCEEDLDIRRKDSGTWPIWGVWTDVNPYEPMPNIEKDLKTIADQIEKGETPKKINYPEGRWVMLKKGKKDEAATYATLQISKDDITYERGEIWPYPGSAMFKPESSTVYSKDLLTVVKTSKPMDYEQVITYHTANDTIYYPGFGNLVRVRDSNLLGVWSSEGSLEMPSVSGQQDVPAGTWYEFVRGGEDTKDLTQKGYSAGYTFTRITVARGKSMEVDKGTAVILPIADDEMITLSAIQSEKVSADGTRSDPVDKDDETLMVKDFDKAAGTVMLGVQEYTFIPGLKLEGKWSTLDPPVDPPDVEGGAFLPRDANGDPFEAPADSQWIEYNSGKKTFVWTAMLSEPQGILVRKGSYKTYGEDLLMLYDMKGTFYAPGKDAAGFKDKPYMFGEKLFQVEQKNDEDKNPVSLDIANIAKFNPIPEEEK